VTSPVVPGSAEAERFIEQLERLSPPQWARVVAELLLVAEDRSEDFDHALTATRRRLYRTSSGGGGTLVSRAEGIVGKAFNRGHPGRSPVGALSAVHATRAAIHGLLARPFISPLDFALLYRPFNGVIPIEGLDPARDGEPAKTKADGRRSPELDAFLTAVSQLGPYDWEGLAINFLWKPDAYACDVALARALQVLQAEHPGTAASLDADVATAVDRSLRVRTGVGAVPLETAVLENIGGLAKRITKNAALGLVLRASIDSGDFVVLTKPFRDLIDPLLAKRRWWKR